MPILKIIAEARDKGLRRSAGVGISVLRTQATLTSRKADRRFLFVSHTIDNSGAPYVLMQIVADFAQHYDPSRLHVVAPEIRTDQLRLLEATGVRTTGRPYLAIDSSVSNSGCDQTTSFSSTPPRCASPTNGTS